MDAAKQKYFPARRLYKVQTQIQVQTLYSAVCSGLYKSGASIHWKYFFFHSLIQSSYITQLLLVSIIFSHIPSCLAHLFPRRQVCLGALPHSTS